MNTFSRSEVGGRLAQIRGKTSHEAFANLLGVHKNTYGGYERGQTEIGAGALARLAASGWSVHWILTGEGPARRDATAVAEPAAAYASQSVKLDREILTRAGRILEMALELARVAIGPTARAEMLGDVYEHLLVHGSHGDQLLEISQVLRDKLQKIQEEMHARSGHEAGPPAGPEAEN